MYLFPEVDKDPFQEGILFLKDKDLAVYLPTMVILMFQENLFEHHLFCWKVLGVATDIFCPKL